MGVPQVISRPVLKRPRDDDEYFDCLDAYLREHGRTSLRKLGAAVQKPKDWPTKKLKSRLLEYRARFVLDLQGCVDVNRARVRRWRWRSQAAVTRVRHRFNGGASGW